MPGALPFFFTGLRIASSLAVIAAIVAEYFGGLQNGLGVAITSAASNSAYARAWAFVLGAIAARARVLPRHPALERAVARRHGGSQTSACQRRQAGSHRTANERIAR